MAKINILFNEKNYSIHEEVLAPATDALKAHLETLGGGGGEGTLEYNKEVQFKKNITAADFEYYLENMTDLEYPCEGVIQFFLVVEGQGALWIEGFKDTRDVTSPAYQLNVINESSNLYFYYSTNGKDWETDIPIPKDCWATIDFTEKVMIPADTPPTIIIKEEDAYVASLDELAVFFDLGGGNLDITLDGAVYKVDSTKLAPATNSLIAHLETLKGGEGGTLVEGETYTLKSDLNDINPNDFMNFPLDSEFIEAYTIFRYDPNVAAGLGYLPQEALSTFVENSITDGWMLTNPDVSEIYIYPRKIASSDGTPIDNNVGWFKMQETEAVGVEVSVTIPSPYDASFGYSLDELAVFFDIPSAGGSGVIEEGGTYTLKTNLHDINPSDFMYTPFDPEAAPGMYTVANFPENEIALVYLDATGVETVLGVNDTNTDAWMLSDFGTQTYIWARKYVADTDNTVADNDFGWMDWLTKQPVTEPITLTISSPYDDSYGGYSLDELAVFFDIPSAGGTLKYDEEVQFKEVIGINDVTAYMNGNIIGEVMQVEQDGMTLEGYSLANAFQSTANPSFRSATLMVQSPTGSSSAEDMIYFIMVMVSTTLVWAYKKNGGTAFIEPDTNSLASLMENDNAWYEISFATMQATPLDEAPAIAIPADAVMNADLETTAIFFNLGGGSGNEGDTKIVINGAEYFVDSAKLAEAKRALAAHLGELAKEPLSAPFANIDTNTLNIYDDTGLATSFDILVDGEIKASVTKEGV